MNKDYSVWLKKGLDKGLSDIEVYATSSTKLTFVLYESKVEKNEISTMDVALIKGIYNGKAAKVKVENFSEQNIDRMLDLLVDSASNITAPEPALIFEGSKDYEVVDETIFDFDSITPNDKIQMLIDIETGIKASKQLSKIESVVYTETESKTVILNSKGLDLNKHYRYAMVYAMAVYKEGEQLKSSMSYQMVKDYNDFNVTKLINDNIKDGVSQLGAKTIASKSYPVVFSNEMFGSILAVFEGIFTGEASFRKVTKLNGKENTKIANEMINLVDDPFTEHALFKVPFDDEGVACHKRYLIEKGVFTGFMHNLKTAEIFKTKSTGNGFTSGISSTNLLLEPTNTTLDELFSDIKEGIYITDLVGLHAGVESVSGDFSLQASGFLIKDGKKDRPLEMLVVSGNFFKMLNDVNGIANDIHFGLYGVGSPSVKVKELTIAGE